MLPSTLPVSERISGCRSGLALIEEQLREAQLRASLNSLQNHLHMKFRLLTYRKTNVKAQGMITKSQALLKRNQRQIDSDAKKYRAAWRAMESLRGEGKSGWKRLSHKDVRMMGNDDSSALGMERKRVGEGYRETSWIWREGGTGELIDQAILDEFVRVEWCKTHARAMRWKEEVCLLVEEKRRVLVTLEHNAKEWEGRATYDGQLSDGKDAAHKEGARAYALSQAAVFRSLARSFVSLWQEVNVDFEGSDEAGDMDGASKDEEEEDAEVLGVDGDADIPDDI
ncbi:hypothetical protein C8R42DRAFT_593680 [Lentinula raphanica]|nr:hypothetical protein C8R42DRAFT_593680 [Lentinula raphanica]